MLVELGESKVKMTGTPAAGVPVRVSRMWHVTGGREAVDIVGCARVLGLVLERWDTMDDSRVVGEDSGIRGN